MSEEVVHNTSIGHAAVNVPRVTIKYCTQCRWMLRAAYFAQELLSTFSTQIGEVALMPATGGIFTVTVIHPDGEVVDGVSQRTKETVLWDRKTEGGFPETKQLKSLLRNIIDPTRNLGHIDRSLNKSKENPSSSSTATINPPPAPAASADPSAASDHQPPPPESDKSKVEGQTVCEDCQ